MFWCCSDTLTYVYDTLQHIALSYKDVIVLLNQRPCVCKHRFVSVTAMDYLTFHPVYVCLLPFSSDVMFPIQNDDADNNLY